MCRDKIVNIYGKRMGAPGSQVIISEITYDKYFFTDGSYTFINNQDSWELVPNKKPKFDPKTLKTFDRVLVRDGDGYTWQGKLFSHINNTSNIYKFPQIQSTRSTRSNLTLQLPPASVRFNALKSKTCGICEICVSLKIPHEAK